MQTATLNAQQALMLHKTRRTSDYVARTQALTDLQEALGLAEAPLRIECFDVSHLGGTNIVASMVVFEDGLPRKRPVPHVRRSPSTTDDTESLYQVLTPAARVPRRADERVEPTSPSRRGRAPVAQAQAVRLPPAAARRRRRPAAGRGRRSARSPTPGTTTSRCAASRSGSRRSGCRGRTTR